MTPWWKNLITVYETQSDVGSILERQPGQGIHYAVKGSPNTGKLTAALGAILEQALQNETVPAGVRNGKLADGVVSAWHTSAERDALAGHGFNPVLRLTGCSYVWGQMFFSDGKRHRIYDTLTQTFTPEFRKLIARPLIRAGFYDPVFDEPPPAPAAVVAITPEQTRIQRAIRPQQRAIGIPTLDARDV